MQPKGRFWRLIAWVGDLGASKAKRERSVRRAAGRRSGRDDDDLIGVAVPAGPKPRKDGAHAKPPKPTR